MRGQLYISAFLTLLVSGTLAGPTGASERWQAPFDTTAAAVGGNDSVLTLPVVLQLVAAQNPMLRALKLGSEAARGGIIQAGVRPNPELETEVENVGWDAPGFSESEIAVVLSQEFELFGQRGARRKVAEAEWQASIFAARVAALDLYLETRERYHHLAHAQEQYELSDISIGLAEDIVATVQDRIDKGAALESELLLARLELQRAGLAQSEAAFELQTAKIELTSLWAAESSEIRVVALPEPKLESVLNRISDSMADSTRELLTLDRLRDQLNAERHLARVENKPNLTFSGGYKRAMADKSNSLVFGLALPLPFRDQNRGALHTLEAQIQQLDFERQQARLESAAAVAAGIAHLRQLDRSHAALDHELLPTAEQAQRTMQTLYQAGRLPYTSLLEANRSLVELRFEYNDILLALREQIIALERLGGIILQADEDFNND